MLSKHFSASRLQTYSAELLAIVYEAISFKRDVANMVPLPFLKPNWFIFALSSGIRAYSTNFVWIELRVIGLKFEGIFESSVDFFKMGMIRLFWKISGMIDVIIMML